MYANLRRITGPSVVLLLALLPAACSRDAWSGEDPTSPAMSLAPGANTVVISGVTYEYGCPDFPCPAMPIVTEHINKGRFMWMPSSPASRPTIYLYVLRLPVQLRLPTPPPHEDTLPSLKLAPYLTGPEAMTGSWMAPDDQLSCLRVHLTLNSPDGRDWDFVSGERVLNFGSWYDGERMTSMPAMRTPIARTEWGFLMDGSYGIYPGYGSPPYDAVFTATVRTYAGGTEAHVVSATVRCNEPEVPAPPAPSLVGDDLVKGKWTGFLWNLQLVCRDVNFDLIVPDEMPWYYDAGSITFDYLRYDHGHWDTLHKTTVATMNSSTWQSVLSGNYDSYPLFRNLWLPYDAYRVTVGGTVERTVHHREFQNEVEHTFVCVAPDLWNYRHGIDLPGMPD